MAGNASYPQTSETSAVSRSGDLGPLECQSGYTSSWVASFICHKGTLTGRRIRSAPFLPIKLGRIILTAFGCESASKTLRTCGALIVFSDSVLPQAGVSTCRGPISPSSRRGPRRFPRLRTAAPCWSARTALSHPLWTSTHQQQRKTSMPGSPRRRTYAPKVKSRTSTAATASRTNDGRTDCR